MLLHQGSAGIGGTAVDIEIQADDLRHTRDTVLGLIAEHTGQPVERVEPRTRGATAGSARTEALDYGFVDQVLTDRRRRAARRRARRRLRGGCR